MKKYFSKRFNLRPLQQISYIANFFKFFSFIYINTAASVETENLRRKFAISSQRWRWFKLDKTDALITTFAF